MEFRLEFRNESGKYVPTVIGPGGTHWVPWSMAIGVIRKLVAEQ